MALGTRKPFLRTSRPDAFAKTSGHELDAAVGKLLSKHITTTAGSDEICNMVVSSNLTKRYNHL